MYRIQSTNMRYAFFSAAVLIAACGAAPALAATIEWRVGPATLVAGQSADLGLGNPTAFACNVGMELRSGPVNDTASFSVPVVRTTIASPSAVPSGRGLVLRYWNGNQVPGEREMVLARVQASCPTATAAQVRKLPVTLSIIERSSGRAQSMLQGVAQ